MMNSEIGHGIMGAPWQTSKTVEAVTPTDLSPFHITSVISVNITIDPNTSNLNWAKLLYTNIFLVKTCMKIK
jgi:hypothetical protein